jgi:hypothetical protein
LPDGRLAVSVNGAGGLGAMNTDGVGFRRFAISGSWRQTAWSPTGQLAAVRAVNGKPEVFVIDPATGSARQLTRDGASSPNWSPDGRRLAVVQRGWIELIGSGGGPVRRLTRGGAPAWAPDGKQLAFVGVDQRLFVISARGGRAQPVGHIRAQSVDWQPVTGKPQPYCQAPAGASVLAGSPDATVTIDGLPPVPPDSDRVNAFSVLGCVTSDGHQRVLESAPPQIADTPHVTIDTVGAAAVTGHYAAVVNESSTGTDGSSNTVDVYDVRTGSGVLKLGGETVECAGLCSSSIDQLVLGSDGATAAHTFGQTSGSSCAWAEQIVANDGTGVRVLDSITTPCNGPPLAKELSQLTLSGDTLTWSHAGTPESAQLK